MTTENTCAPNKVNRVNKKLNKNENIKNHPYRSSCFVWTWFLNRCNIQFIQPGKTSGVAAPGRNERWCGKITSVIRRNAHGTSMALFFCPGFTHEKDEGRLYVCGDIGFYRIHSGYRYCDCLSPA